MGMEQRGYLPFILHPTIRVLREDISGLGDLNCRRPRLPEFFKLGRGITVNNTSHHAPKVITDQRLGTNGSTRGERAEGIVAYTPLGLRVISRLYLDRLRHVCKCDYDRRSRVM